MAIVNTHEKLRTGIVTSIDDDYNAVVQSVEGTATIPLAVARDDVTRVYLVGLTGGETVAIPEDLVSFEDSQSCAKFLVR